MPTRRVTHDFRFFRGRLRGPLLRAVAVMVAVGATVVSLAGCQSLSMMTANRVEPTPDRVASPAGASTLVKFSAGQPIPATMSVVDRDRNSHGFSLANGLLTHGTPDSNDAASYLMSNLAPHRVTRVGAVANFASDPSGSIALLVGQGQVPAKDNQAAPNAAAHFVATPTEWIYAIWNSGASSQTVLARGSYRNAFDRSHAVYEVTLQGDTAKVYLPDATSVTVTDDRIEQYSGNWAIWELFEGSADQNPASFRQVWAA